MNRLANLFKKTTLVENTVIYEDKQTLKDTHNKENILPCLNTIDKQPILRRPCPNQNDYVERTEKMTRRPGKHDSIFLFNSGIQKYVQFKCYIDTEMVPQKFREISIERRQDDDCASDDDVLECSKQYLYKELMNALQKENKRKYSQKFLL